MKQWDCALCGKVVYANKEQEHAVSREADFDMVVTSEIAEWCDRYRNFQLISEGDTIHITVIEVECCVHYEHEDGAYTETGLIPYRLVKNQIPQDNA